jgi:DNA end-binding protein Ku
VERLQQRLITPDEEEPVKPQERAKAFEYGRDQYVVLRDEEIKRLRPKTSTTMEILSSAKLAEIDPVHFETSYYVVPDQAGEKPYALLFASLRQSGYVALAKMAMHGREHVMVIRPGRRGLLAHTMFYSDEVRAEYEFNADVAAVHERELHLATEFVRALAAPFEPEQFRDEYRDQLRALIEAKAAKREVATQEQRPGAAAPVVDIMEALKRSIQAAKKPAQKATAPVPTGKRKETTKPRARRA